MRLVSHFPRTDAGTPKLEINPKLPMELARWRVAMIVNEYMVEEIMKGTKKEDVKGIVGYNKFYQLDKLLMLAIWMRYDGLGKETLTCWADWQNWWLTKATPPDYISRARRWFRDNKLAEFPKHVVDAANRSEKSIANQFSGGDWDS